MATETINAKIDALQFIEGLVPATPASTKWRTYFKTDGYYYVDDAGVEIGPLTGAGAVAAVDELQYTTGLPAPADAEGLTYWDSVNGTLAWHTDIAGVTVNGGQEVQIPVKNVSGSTLLNGQVVYISGAASGLPKVDLAKADATATSNVIAMVTADIANGLTGKVTAFGSVRELDTSGFTAGDKLYLSATTAGAVTATMPVAPNFKAVIGVVEVSNATTGKIHFTHGAALSLADIADVNETAPTDGQILKWDAANSYYIPSTTKATRVYNSADISIADATATALTFNSEYYDTDGSHSTSSLTSRLTAQKAGIKTIYGQAAIEANAVGLRDLYLQLNGTTIIARMIINAVTVSGNGSMLLVTTQYDLAATDYIELFVRQDSGGSLNVISGGDYSPILGWCDLV